MKLVTAVAHPRSEKSRVWVDTIQALQQQGIVLKTEISRFAGHSRELARTLAHQAPVMIALGGDGTIHEVINGLFDAGGDLPTLAPIPLGTGNDYCRGLGIRLEKECILRLLGQGQVRRMDLALLRCTGADGNPVEVFWGCTSSAGFAAEVAQRTNELVLKSGLKGLSYSLALGLCLSGYRNRSGELEIDGVKRELKGLFNFNVANIKYYGSGMVAAPRADPFDGHLDVVSMELDRLRVLANLPRNYSGNFDGVKGVEQLPARSLKLVTDPPALVHADGQVVGMTPMQVEIRPQAIEVLLPP